MKHWMEFCWAGSLRSSEELWWTQEVEGRRWFTALKWQLKNSHDRSSFQTWQQQDACLAGVAKSDWLKCTGARKKRQLTNWIASEGKMSMCGKSTHPNWTSQQQEIHINHVILQRNVKWFYFIVSDWLWFSKFLWKYMWGYELWCIHWFMTNATIFKLTMHDAFFSTDMLSKVLIQLNKKVLSLWT